MSKPKTIDLTKLTPEERCRVMVDTVPSQQFKDMFVTGTSTSVIKYTPTEEEIIKEWDALNYKIEFQSDKYLVLRNRDLGDEFYIEKLNKKYGKYDVATLIYENITFEEHQLLTKTFKMLGWEV